MEVVKKSYNFMDNFISENKEAAFAWAGFSSRNKECFINNEKYYVQYLHDVIIEFKDKKRFMEGNVFKFVSKENEKEVFLYMEAAKKIREKSEIVSHLICFNEDQFLSA